jgi:hypothetical protein
MWKSPAVAGSLDALLARLADEGADTYALRDDRGYAIYALLELQRFEEAVGQFRALGALADAGPWDYFSEPRLKFLSLRGSRSRRRPRARASRLRFGRDGSLLSVEVVGSRAEPDQVGQRATAAWTSPDALWACVSADR